VGISNQLTFSSAGTITGKAQSRLAFAPSLEREVDENDSEDYPKAITGKGSFSFHYSEHSNQNACSSDEPDEVRAFDISLRSIALSEIDSDARTQSKGHTFVGAELALEHQHSRNTSPPQLRSIA
jgi:hypothetical protein